MNFPSFSASTDREKGENFVNTAVSSGIQIENTSSSAFNDSLPFDDLNLVSIQDQSEILALFKDTNHCVLISEIADLQDQ